MRLPSSIWRSTATTTPARRIRPQLRAFHLQTEPWLFVIDRSGKVSTRIEGGFSGEEMRQAIDAAVRRGGSGEG